MFVYLKVKMTHKKKSSKKGSPEKKKQVRERFQSPQEWEEGEEPTKKFM